MGQRFRMVATVVDVIAPRAAAAAPAGRAGRCGDRALTSRPTRPPGSYAGGSHHTSLGFAVTPEHLADFASMSGVEFLLIDEHTSLDRFRDQLRWNDLYYLLARGL